MHRSPIAVALVLSCVALSEAYGAAGPQIATETADLTQAACEAGHAYASRGLSTLDKLTADDYSQTDVRGGVLRRLEWREFVRSRKSDLTVECDNVEVRFYGGAAVVTGGWTYTNHKPSGDITTHSRWTSVWTKEHDGWKRHTFQNTYVNAQADACASDARP